MGYQVSLPVFEGPLDLLLDLIKKHELDIYNIPIAFITGKYLDYLSAAEQADINLSGDFLVMASTLLAIKATMLLPSLPIDPETGEPVEDPRDELVQRLLEYKLYKENAQVLSDLHEKASNIFYRALDDKRLLESLPPMNPVENITTEDLQIAFTEVVRQAKARGRVITLTKEALSIREHMDMIIDRVCNLTEPIDFKELFVFDNLLDLVTCFMAMLELIHSGHITVTQEKMYGQILIHNNMKKG